MLAEIFTKALPPDDLKNALNKTGMLNTSKTY